MWGIVKDIGQKDINDEVERGSIFWGLFDRLGLNFVSFFWILIIVVSTIRIWGHFLYSIFISSLSGYYVFVILVLVVVLIYLFWLVIKKVISGLGEKGKTILVKREWDNFPHWDKRRGGYIFVGREDLRDSISGWLSEANGGSLLLSGVRGSGKTALVYSAVDKWLDGRNWFFRFPSSGFFSLLEKVFSLLSYCMAAILPFTWYKKAVIVKIEATQLVSKKKYKLITNEEGEESLKEIEVKTEEVVLDEIIQEMYFSQIDNFATRLKVNKLFNLSIGRGKKTQARSLSMNMIKAVSTFLALVVPVFYIWLKGYLKSQNKPELDIDGEIYKLWAGLSLTSILSWNFSNKETNEIDTNSFSYKYSELLNIVENSCTDFVFIFDELDKLGQEDDGANNAKVVNEVIRGIKNLITTGTPKFVFLVGEKYMYETVEPGSEASTYFTWRQFLQTATKSDVRNYILSVCPDLRTVMGDRDFEELVHYLHYESKGVFFDLKQRLRDYIKANKFIFGRYVHTFNLEYWESNKRDNEVTTRHKVVMSHLVDYVYSQGTSKNFSSYKSNYAKQKFLFDVLDNHFSEKRKDVGLLFVQKYGEGEHSVPNIDTQSIISAGEMLVEGILKKHWLEVGESGQITMNLMLDDNSYSRVFEESEYIKKTLDEERLFEIIEEFRNKSKNILKVLGDYKYWLTDEGGFERDIKLLLFAYPNVLDVYDKALSVRESVIKAIQDEVGNEKEVRDFVDQGLVKDAFNGLHNVIEEVLSDNSKLLLLNTMRRFGEGVIRYMKPKFLENIYSYDEYNQKIKLISKGGRAHNLLLVGLPEKEFNHADSDAEVGQKQVSYPIEINNLQKIKSIKLEFATQSKYWRLGFCFGDNGQLQKKGAFSRWDKLALFHIYSNADTEGRIFWLWYPIVTSLRNRDGIAEKGVVLEAPSTENVVMRIDFDKSDRETKSLMRVSIGASEENLKEIIGNRKFVVRNSKLNVASLLMWGDGNPWLITVKKLEVSYI